jgi:hypothetical protein
MHTIVEQYCKEENAPVQQTVKGNETGVHHYPPASKHQSMDGITCHHPGPRNSKRTFCRQSNVLFWYFSGSMLEHYQNHGQMVSSKCYCAMHEEELQPTIYSKCRGILTGVVPHHDNTQLIQQQ